MAKPAARLGDGTSRVGDMAACAGPPDTIAMGCSTVLLGEVGAGGPGGGPGSGGAGLRIKPGNSGPIARLSRPRGRCRSPFRVTGPHLHGRPLRAAENGTLPETGLARSFHRSIFPARGEGSAASPILTGRRCSNCTHSSGPRKSRNAESAPLTAMALPRIIPAPSTRR